jgi:hypothetical protein
MTGERANRIKFREIFEKYIVEVRGFLLVKWLLNIVFVLLYEYNNCIVFQGIQNKLSSNE